MLHLLGGGRVGVCNGSAEGVRRRHELCDDAAILRGEAPGFGRRQVCGDGEGDEVGERGADVSEALLELGEAWRAGRGRGRIGTDRAERRPQQRAAVVLVGGAIGVDQCQGFARGETVLLAGREHGLLVRGRQRRERLGERGTQGAAPQPLRTARRQASAERAAPPDPRGLAPEQMGRRRDGQAVVEQRADDRGLVAWGERARRSVGREQQELVLQCAARVLDDCWHQRRARLAPARQALEAVEDLVVAVYGRDHAERQLGEVSGPRRQRTWAQGGVALAQSREGHELDGAGREWRRGRGANGVVVGLHDLVASRHRSERHVVVDRGCRERAACHHADAGAVGALLGRELHFEPRAEQVCGTDFLATAGQAAAGTVQCHELATRYREATGRGALEHEVVGDRLTVRRRTVEGEAHLDHAVTACAAPQARRDDRAVVGAGCRQVVLQVSVGEPEGGHVHAAPRRRRNDPV
jgi:hypothetical protein